MTLHVVGQGSDFQPRKFFFFFAVLFCLFVCLFSHMFFYLLAGFSFYSYGCPVAASLGVAIKVFLLIKYPSLGLTKLQFGEKIEV